jgi:hypothetical protein
LEHRENSLVVLLFSLFGGESREETQVVFLHRSLSASRLEFTLGAMFVQHERRRRCISLLIANDLEDALYFHPPRRQWYIYHGVITTINDPAHMKPLSERFREGERIKCEQELVVRREFFMRHKADGNIGAIEPVTPAMVQHQGVKSDTNVRKGNNVVKDQCVAATLKRPQIGCARKTLSTAA